MEGGQVMAGGLFPWSFCSIHFCIPYSIARDRSGGVSSDSSVSVRCSIPVARAAEIVSCWHLMIWSSVSSFILLQLGHRPLILRSRSCCSFSVAEIRC